MSRQFDVGEVVRVYGVPGPRMVVAKIISDAKGVLVRCFWFNRRNEFEGQDFGPSFLCKATPWEQRSAEQNDLRRLAGMSDDEEATDAAE